MAGVLADTDEHDASSASSFKQPATFLPVADAGTGETTAAKAQPGGTAVATPAPPQLLGHPGNIGSVLRASSMLGRSLFLRGETKYYKIWGKRVAVRQNGHHRALVKRQLCR